MHRAVGALPLLLLLLLAPSFLTTTPTTMTTGTTEALPQTLPSVVPCNKSLGSCWAPPIMTKWQWQLSCDTPNTCTNLTVRVPFYVIDWNDNPGSTVSTIHSRGAHAYCYIDIGTWESWRPDANKFPKSVLGNAREGYPDERWLDIRQISILGPIMKARMDVCHSKGFDGVEFDNVDGWLYSTGFPLTQQNYAYYTAWMANAAHAKGLAASWENAIENTASLQPYMQAVLYEECYANHECNGAQPMNNAGKWAGGVEYLYSNLQFCPTYGTNHIAGMFKHLILDSYRKPCPLSGALSSSSSSSSPSSSSSSSSSSSTAITTPHPPPNNLLALVSNVGLSVAGAVAAAVVAVLLIMRRKKEKVGSPSTSVPPSPPLPPSPSE